MSITLAPREETARKSGNPGSGTLLVEAWKDPVIDEVGHDPRSLYVETFWLPILGPSTTWLLRRFGWYLEDAVQPVEVEIEELARRLGIGERTGPNAPFHRSVKRAVDFQMAQWHGRVLSVRRLLPPLARRHLRRLPPALQREHEERLGGAVGTTSERVRSHAWRVALSLVENGADQSLTESTLVRYGFTGALAASASHYAGLEHSRRAAARRHATGDPPVAHPSRHTA